MTSAMIAETTAGGLPPHLQRLDQALVGRAVAMYGAGQRAMDVALELGISRSSVLRAARRAGVSRAPLRVTIYDARQIVGGVQILRLLADSSRAEHRVYLVRHLCCGRTKDLAGHTIAGRVVRETVYCDSCARKAGVALRCGRPLPPVLGLDGLGPLSDEVMHQAVEHVVPVGSRRPPARVGREMASIERVVSDDSARRLALSGAWR